MNVINFFNPALINLKLQAETINTLEDSNDQDLSEEQLASINPSEKYNLMPNYCTTSSLFSNIPKRQIENEDDPDSYLWTEEKNNLDKDSPDPEKSNEISIDKMPNFFINGQSYRFSENSFFIFKANSKFRKFLAEKILYTKFFQGTLFIYIVLNLIAYGLYDFDYRLKKESIFSISSNNVAYVLEIICNIFFLYELVLRLIVIGVIFDKNCYLRTIEGFINTILLGLNWIFIIFHEENLEIYLIDLLLLVKGIRIIRTLRILLIYEEIRKTIYQLLHAIPAMARTFISLILVFLFYTIWGLHLFKGVEEYRCRLTKEPEFRNGEYIWEKSEIEFLCGYWTCPEHTYCRSPATRGLPFDIEELNSESINWGQTNFSNFFKALFTVVHFFSISSWSSINYTFWKTVDGSLTAVYFGSLLIIGSYIMINLFLASVYDTFIQQMEEEKKPKTSSNKNSREDAEQFFNTLSKMNNNEKVNSKKQPTASLSVKNENKVHTMNGRKDSTVTQFQPYKTLIEAHSSISFFKKFRTKMISFFEKTWVRRTISFVIIFDIIILCLDDASSVNRKQITLHLLDFICFCFFFLEINFKMLVIGYKASFQSFLFIIDLMIVYSNFFVYIFESTSGINIFGEPSEVGKGIRVLKMIRLFRIIYYTQYFSSLSVILRSLLKTMQKMTKYFIILGSLIVVIALMGMVLFSNRARIHRTHREGIIPDPHGEPLRINYDNFYNAVVAVFLILFNEEWHVIMYHHTKAIGVISIIFNVPIVFVALIIIMKLLVAVFLNFFIGYIKHEIIEEQNGDVLANFKQIFRSKLFFIATAMLTKTHEKQNKFTQLKQAFYKKIWKLSQPLESEGENKSRKILFLIPGENPNSDVTERRFLKKNLLTPAPESSSPRRSQLGNPVTVIPIKINEKWNKKSLFLFSSTNKIRLLMKRILDYKQFEYFMLVIIFISSIILVISSPFEPPDSDIESALRILDQIVTIIYGIEVIMNIISFGFIFGSKTYLRRSIWNILDLTVFIFSLLGVVLPRGTIRINSMKVFRTLRILKIGQKNESIRIATQALISALPNILRLLFFMVIFLITFGVFGMAYKKNTYYSCFNVNLEEDPNLIKTKIDCFDNGGDWVNADMHFDNIFAALATLFQVASAEGWLVEMYRAVDSKGVDLQPHNNTNKIWFIYYLCFFFVGNFLIINMFIAVIGETFLDQKSKASKFNLLTDHQKEWALIKSSIYAMKPKKMKLGFKFKFQDKLSQLLKKKPTQYVYKFIIGFNVLILTLFYHRQSQDEFEILNNINKGLIYAISGFFALRIICISSLQNFIRSLHNRLVGITLILSYISFGMDSSNVELNSVAKAFQVILAYQIVKKIKIVQRLFHTILFVLPSLSNILSLMLLILYIYSIIGMDIFAYLKPQKITNGFDVDFRSFARAVHSLIRVMSAEMWFQITSDCVREIAPNFVCFNINTYEDYVKYGTNGCGSSLYYFYLFTYQLIFCLIIFNLLIATILVSYSEVYKAETSAIDDFLLLDINKFWSSFDPEGKGFINYKDFWTMSSQTAVKLGVPGVYLEPQNKRKFLNALEVPLYENHKEKIYCYKFHDVIVRLSKISMSIKKNVTDLEPPPEFQNEFNSPELKSKIKSNRIALGGRDALSRTIFHSGHMASMLIIYSKIRKWLNIARKMDNAADIQGLHAFLRKKEVKEGD